MDSKISQLPSADRIYDHDLLIAVTGYNIEGAYPDNVKVSFDRIRNDIVRLDEMIFLLSGFSGYYNSGNNTITITTHQRPGNLISLTYDNNYPYIQNISTTGLNAIAGTGVYLKNHTVWPHVSEIGILDKLYEASNTYTIPITTTSIDESLVFPLTFPSSVQTLNYTKWKCEGYYQNITLTTEIPITQPNITGPTGQAVSWSTYTISSLIEGKLTPSLFNFSYLLSNPNIKQYNTPLYNYTDTKILINHDNLGPKSSTINNLFFLSFFNIANNLNSSYSRPSGCVAFRTIQPWFLPPSAILFWSGIYNNNGILNNITGLAIATGYITNITISGHRFLEIKPI